MPMLQPSLPQAPRIALARASLLLATLLSTAWLLTACQRSDALAVPVATQSTIARLDLGNATGTDDDPSLIKARDGFYYLVFLSDRSGGKQLWVTRSANGLTWSAPRQITDNADENLYPTLLQTADGLFHLCWGRFAPSAGFTQHIYYARSADGLDWSGAAQVALTSGAVADRFASMLAVGSSELRIYFSSAQRSLPGKAAVNDDLLVMRSLDLGATWSAPQLLASLSSATEEDRFPWVTQVAPGSFRLVFNRQATTNLFDPTSDVFTAESADGLTWPTPVPITSSATDNVPDLWPNILFAPVARQWYVSWTSTAFVSGGVVVMPVGGQYPAQATDLAGAMNIGGWSTRAAGSLLVWVNSTTGSPQLWSGLNAF